MYSSRCRALCKRETISFSVHIPKCTSLRALCSSHLSIFCALSNGTDSTRHLETFLLSTTMFPIIQCLGGDPTWAWKTSAENWESAHFPALPWVTGMWCLMSQLVTPARSPWPLTGELCVSTRSAAAAGCTVEVLFPFGSVRIPESTPQRKRKGICATWVCSLAVLVTQFVTFSTRTLLGSSK